MSNLPVFPPGSEFSLLYFELEFQEAYRVTLEALLRLRRDLRTAACLCLGGAGDERFAALFEPPLPADPAALRRYQKPGPPFVILLEPDCQRDYETGDRLELSVVFWGRGIQLIADFAGVVQALGRTGLHRGEGRFELTAVSAQDPAGNRRSLWREGEEFGRLAPPVNEVGWWLERARDLDPLLLEFVTPARLLSAGRPLFRVSFRQLFPFILRRVTAMHYFHCGIELVDDPEPLLSAADRVEELENRLVWQDWRTLEGPEQAQELGGVVGSVRLAGETLAEILWVVRLGTLMNLGKGASFGAGRYRLQANRPACAP